MAEGSGELQATDNAVNGMVNGDTVQGRDIGGVHHGSGHVINNLVLHSDFSKTGAEYLLRFSERVERAQERAQRLLDREQEIRAELRAQTERANRLERELDEARRLADDSSSATEELRRQLRELREKYEQEVRRGDALRAELDGVVRRRQEAEDEVERLRDERRDLADFFGTAQDLLELNFVRAEEERREKELPAARCAVLEGQVKALQETLARYQWQG